MYRHPKNDPRYKELPRALLPATESLEETYLRVMPFWHDEIAVAMLEGKRPFVVAHANSLRAIFKHLDRLSDEGRL